MVVVTGSLIPQIQQETASPVIAISAEDIQRQGFRNVSDVLRAQPLATGAVQDNQFSGGFTPGATTISLLGLSPGFTLILIDGRPLADYPLLYNGQANFTDLSSIPSGMVERIDILPGNQSAIYGSAAIAGVVNIILKKHLEGTQLSARVGGYQESGGDNLLANVTGGQSWDKLDVTYGLQYSSQKPIWGFQRKRFDSTNDSPNAGQQFGSRSFLILDGFTNTYFDPGQAACDGLADNFGGTTIHDFRPGRGFYCGSRAEPGYTTFLNDESGTSAYVNANLKVGDNTELYSSLLYSDNRVESNGGTRFWVPDVNGTGGYVFDDRDFSLNLYQLIFSPEETGGRNTNNDINNSQSYNFALGVRGAFGDSTWDYDAYYSRSQYELKDHQKWPLTADIEDFFRNQFLGPQLGTYYGYPVYHPDQAAFYQSLTPAEYASFQGTIRSNSKTWTHNINLMITNTNLLDLPAGPMGLAALVQVGKQSWENPTDQRVIAGDFWGLTGTQGAGKRDSWAGALEFRVPLFSMLTANASGRYDSYKNVGAGDDARFTYKLGLEFRPIDSLLIRGNYATAFRAPDMSYIYAGASGFFTNVTDYFRCEEAGQPLDTCTWNPVNTQGSRHGNPDLKSITADSFGYGFIWSPTDKFDLRADYYNVNIGNEVSDLSIDRILRDENECRHGRLDITSPTCVDALARIQRTLPTDLIPNQLQLVTINPINISKERVSGVIAGTTVRFEAGRAGNFEVRLDYNDTFTHKYTQFPGDTAIDLLTDGFNSSEFKTIMTGDIVWDIGKLTTTLHGTRYGATPNYAEQLGVTTNNGVAAGDIGAYTLFNVNFNYRLTDSSEVAVTVNNVEDKGPPKDPSYDAYPYYNIFNFNGYGRAFWVQYNMSFGAAN
jgi:outer membrane receptor protein involved in Fe transport